MSQKKVWILTFEVNEYDQQGEYFIAAFLAKPDTMKIAKALTGRSEMPKDIMEAIALIEHILKGGGRQKTESIWYNLIEVDAG